jgi:hypothetical protein
VKIEQASASVHFSGSETQEVITKTKKSQNGGFCRPFFSPTGC